MARPNLAFDRASGFPIMPRSAAVAFRFALVLPLLAGILSACSGAAALNDNGTPVGANLVIYGSIGGLLGSGLVLQNNGTGDLTVSAPANSFLFEGIREKSDYAITVKTQPTSPWQQCTVSAGAGRIVFEAVRNVTIACVTQTFAVRGTVTGLTASGLTLRLNAESPQVIAAGATSFAFPNIDSGTRYTVTIGTQPTGQTCTVNGSGIVGSADITGVTVTCSSQPGLTIGGTVAGLAGSGLALSLNGGAPLAIPSGATAFTFPNVVPSGTAFSVAVVATPRSPTTSCMLRRGSGRVVAANVTDVFLWCHSNGALDSYTGTYVYTLNGRRNYLTLWFDGTFSLALHIDDPSCANNGNGFEYGVYKRATNNSFWVQIAADDNGGCGLWFGGGTPGSGGGFVGTMVRSGNTLTLAGPEGPLALEAVPSVSTSLVGAFTRADGQDGSFVVFEADGTYLYQDVQANPGGHERGCYLVAGATFTTSLAATCRPNGFPARDQNPASGFSTRNGAPISFTIVSPTLISIDGVSYARILPAG
jgi:hypothetical protein